VPEEFAAAYWAAYEQALTVPAAEPDADEGGDGSDVEDTDELPVRRGPIRIGTHRSAERYARDDDSATWFERVRDSGWLVPFLLALLALLLVLGAYTVGRRFADQVAGDVAPGSEPTVVIGEGGNNGGKQPVTNQKPGAGAWDGKITRVGGVRARVGCTSKSGVDASGKQVTYGPSNLLDGIADTTWRCDGSAIGEKITLDLDGEVPIGQVGLIPGYAKTDEASLADRFAENNRITRVRWTIGDTEVVQRMSGSPTDRNLQLLRVPRTSADEVELEILAVRKGPRDTTAISEIQLGQAG
jgi:hypothetical protein